MLELTSVNKHFGTLHALTDLSFTVHPGEIYGFVGSNGAGKTTAMRGIMGVLAMDSGQILWKGQPITREQRRDFGYIPEERGLYPKMKVGAQLEYFGRLHGFTPEGARRAMEHWTERLGLETRRGDNVQALSLGNQQRVQLAAALVHEPVLMVLDEPFSGLDPVAVEVMSDVIREATKRGAAVMFSSHQLDLVERLCDRIGIISHGQMVTQGRPAQLRAEGSGGEFRAVARCTPSQLREALVSAGVPGEQIRSVETVDLGESGGTSAEAFFTPPSGDHRAILHALIDAVNVVSFGPHLPHLNEIFQSIVTSAPATSEAESTTERPRGLRALFAGGRRA